MAILDNPKRERPVMMNQKGKSSLFSFARKPSSLSSSISLPPIPPSPLQQSFSVTMMEANIENAEKMITKWDPNGATYLKFVFIFQENRKEGKDFIKCIKDLRRAMHFLVTNNSGSDKLALAQRLTQIAMKRLEKEFYQILSANRQYLDPESVSGQSSRLSVSLSSNSEDEHDLGSDEEIQRAGQSISEIERLSELAVSDLKSIADCMIGSGYGAECLKIYRLIRKSIVDEALYRLGIEKYSSSQINRMSSESFDRHVKNWMDAVKICVKALFHGERFLCDHVFSSSDKVRESCFADISKEGATNLFKFPELVAKSKRSPERIFPLMDLHESICDLWPEIESIFSFESISAIKLQALNSLHILEETVRTILSEFDSSIQKNSSKTMVPGGGIHPLTLSVMNYISLLANYCGALTDIVADSTATMSSPMPESYFNSPNPAESPTSAVSIRLAWTLLVLLCKLDSKAELYNDKSLSYLFLANNLQFIVEKVNTTSLKYLLGDEWISKHERKVKLYAANYEAMAWNKVFSSLSENSSTEMSPETVKVVFQQFNSAFDEAYRKQTSWVIPDGKLRDEIKVSIAQKLVSSYREFYDTHMVTLKGEKNLEVLVRFAPDNLGNYLSGLFHGTDVTRSSSSFSSSSESWNSRATRRIP